MLGNKQAEPSSELETLLMLLYRRIRHNDSRVSTFSIRPFVEAVTDI